LVTLQRFYNICSVINAFYERFAIKIIKGDVISNFVHFFKKILRTTNRKIYMYLHSAVMYFDDLLLPRMTSGQAEQLMGSTPVVRMVRLDVRGRQLLLLQSSTSTSSSSSSEATDGNLESSTNTFRERSCSDESVAPDVGGPTLESTASHSDSSITTWVLSSDDERFNPVESGASRSDGSITTWVLSSDDERFTPIGHSTPQRTDHSNTSIETVELEIYSPESKFLFLLLRH
jgi:hypothetical protein